MVRSWIKRRTNLVKAEKMLKINSPEAHVVAIVPALIERNKQRKVVRVSFFINE